MRAQFPKNESFEQMLGNCRESGDMILELKNEEFACHKIVITATSDYFKKALKENELINKHQYHIRGPYK
jgi:BTB/POZ domain